MRARAALGSRSFHPSSPAPGPPSDSAPPLLPPKRYPAGESYLDVIQRLEPVIIEMEREREYVVVVAHQVGGVARRG
jgi:broad specificity phosphatase PhoE